MKRRKVTACAMAALMAMGLVGTVMPVYAKSNLKNVDDVVEIKMAVWTSGAADIYNKAAEGFNQTHDNIKLSVEMQSGDYNQYLGAKTAAKDLPDLFEVSSYSQVYDFAQNGLLADVSDHEFVDKLYDNAKEAVTYDGKVWGFPQMYEWWGVLYNKDLFKKAGIEKVPETFDEMKAVCEKLQAANITPFTAIYKDNWTVSQEFCSLFGGVLGGKDKIDSWLDSMNKGEGSFKVDGVDRVFDFMDLMKENSGQNYMDSDAATGFYAFANQEAAMIFLSDAATISVGSVTQDLPIGFFAVPVSDNADDAEVVAWPAKGVTISESGFAPSGMWTCQFYNGLKPTSDTTVTVRCLNSGAVWKIDPANLLDSQAYQVNGTLISYADNSIAFKVGGVYEITYEHLNDRDGKDASYTYRTVYEKAYLSSDGKEEPQQILFDKDSMELTPGSTEKLTAIIHPEDARNKRIYFTSTNPAVATVNECGEITAHAAGTAVITAVSEAGNITANCKVTVVQKKAET